METSEIIAGLKDLIHDRESFITPDNDKFYGEDNPFRYDKAVLQAAIDELLRRTTPENKALTSEGCESEDSEDSEEMCEHCSRAIRSDCYARKLEGGEKP